MSTVNKIDEKNDPHEETEREQNPETLGEENTMTQSHEPSESPSSSSDKVEGDDCSTEEEDEKIGWLEKLQVFLSSKLKLDEKEDVPQVLDEVNIDGIVSYIKSGRCKNIITMAGAGISTSAGIPDFRSPDSGLYSNLSKYNLPHPEAIFDIEFFKENPQPFFALAKELYPGTFNPTPSHYFIRLLNDKGLLLRHYTQNIDTLEHIAGIPVDKLVEAHGTFRTAHCLSCSKAYEQEWMKDEIFADRVPSCEVCGEVVKPDIVFFRESLPSRFFKFMTSDFKQCDLLIIMGTSLTVQPFASLVNDVSASCPRLLINREKVGCSDPMMAAFQGFFGRGGLDFDSANNKRDVTLIGDCDQGCSTLAEKLGWKEDLEALISQKVQA